MKTGKKSLLSLLLSLGTSLFWALNLSGCRHSFLELDGDFKVGITIETKTLSNGLQIIVVPDPTVTAVSFQSWYKVGSADEKLGKTGLAHLFEHLMFKGTPLFGPKEFFTQLETKGAEVNATTTRDYTVFYETLPPYLLKKAMEMESDRLQNLIFSEELLESEKLVVLEERRLKTENSIEGKMQEALWSMVYKVHPYGRPIIGYPRDLLALSVEDLKVFFGHYYNASQLTIVVVGGVRADQVFEWAELYYSKLPKKEKVKHEFDKEPEQLGERRVTLFDQVTSERALMGFPITSALQKDSFALDVLRNILFEGQSSRLVSRLVEKENLVLDIEGSSFTPKYGGIFTIGFTPREGVPVEKIEKIIFNEIQEIATSGVKPDELHAAVRQLTMDILGQLRTPSGLGNLIGNVAVVYDDPRQFTQEIKHYLSITSEDLKRVAGEYFDPNRKSIVVMRPEKK